MRRQGSDSKAITFEHAADRAKLTGRRRKIAWLYFFGMSAKGMRHVAKVPDGTMKRDLVFLHGRFGTSRRVEFVHRVYELGRASGRSDSSLPV